jgi:hypothetical protein
MTHRERLYADELLEAAEECLRAIAVTSVSCDYKSGILRLRGRVPSHHHREHIQESVVALKDEAHVRNEVEVVPPRPR